MPWFRVDDGLASSRKVLGIPRSRRAAAMGLWVLAGTWCSGELTDGFIGSHMVEELCGTDEAAADLVRVGLWLRDDERDGYQFANYSDYNPLKVDVEAEREAARERMRKVREGRRGTRSEHGSTPVQSGSDEVRANTSEVQGEFALPRPDPLVPTELEPREATPDGVTDLKSRRTLDDQFADWWALYPKKTAKADARKAWDRARRHTDTAVLLAGLRRYVAALTPADRQFIPNPATWLNGGRWEDEPAPAGAPVGDAPGSRDADGALTTAAVDEILGRDLWQLPDPPEDVEPGTRRFIDWARATTLQHYEDRRAAAESKIRERGAS